MRLLNSQWNDAKSLQQMYHDAEPFPFLVMDDFLAPGVLEVARAEMQKYQHWGYDDTPANEPHQPQKYFAPHPAQPESIDSLAQHCPTTFSVLTWLKNPKLLSWLEQVTGISGIVADTDWLGGGVHRVTQGGCLDIHADFNVHWKENLHRRLNLLIYLNPGWQDAWGGSLELWDQQLTACQHKIVPVFNRAVLFRITDDAYHGHPQPVSSPPGMDRLSLAMYYYTHDRPEHEKAPNHGVIWKDKLQG